jgi:hypothetical protein
VDPRRIKIHRSYTVEQLARVLGCHKNSIWLWLKKGLEPLNDGKRPLLIQGSEARRFLETKRRGRKRRCQVHELYCLRCREPRSAVRNRAHYSSSVAGPALLIAQCSVCGTRTFKRVSARSLSELERSFDLQIHEAEETPKLAA